MAGARGSMDLCTKDKAPPGLELHMVGERDEGERRKLKAALEKTNQAGLYQNVKGHSFSPTFPKKETVCGFPVTMVMCTG